MNERIRELAEQAGGYMSLSDEHESQAEGIIQKFAELIIKECATLIDAEEIQSSYGDMIKQHFGVGHG